MAQAQLKTEMKISLISSIVDLSAFFSPFVLNLSELTNCVSQVGNVTGKTNNGNCEREKINISQVSNNCGAFDKNDMQINYSFVFLSTQQIHSYYKVETRCYESSTYDKSPFPL